MAFVIQVVVGMVVMAAVDAPAIKYLIRPTLEKTAPGISRDTPDLVAGAIFYVGYVSLVVYLSQLSATTTSDVAYNSAMLGLFAYGTYEFTNKAVLQGWSWRMVVTDTLWGVVLTTAVGTLSYIIAG